MFHFSSSQKLLVTGMQKVGRPMRDTRNKNVWEPCTAGLKSKRTKVIISNLFKYDGTWKELQLKRKSLWQRGSFGTDRPVSMPTGRSACKDGFIKGAHALAEVM